MAELVQRDFLDAAVLARLQNLPLFARKPMLGSVAGRHKSPHRGSSIEFAEYRKYVPGDDTRRLDWRAYGRSDRFYIKEFEADTNLRLCIVLDTSGSMRYGADGITKLDYARRLAGPLAYIAARQGDAVGLTCASEALVREIPAKRNAAHLRHVFDGLSEARARGETGLVDALHTVASKTPQRALFVIISDLFVAPEELVPCFQHLRFRKHEVVVFHLLEQAEIDFDFSRPVRFVDLEGGNSLLVDASVIRRTYQEALQRYLGCIDGLVQDAEVDYHRVSLEETPVEVLARFLLGRTPKGARR